MMDLIDKQSVIENLKGVMYSRPVMTFQHDINAGIIRAIGIIQLEKTIESKLQWIPVTERLPKESDGTVLVCMPDVFPFNEKEPYPNAKHNQQVDIALHSEHSGNWYFSGGAVGDVEPIAWMPLPEPYQEAKDVLD